MSSRDRSFSQSFTPSEALEHLEPRVLLSSGHLDLGLVSESEVGTAGEIRWLGAEVDAIQGSWILTFDQQFGQEGSVAEAQRIMSRLGIDDAQISPIGSGWNAMIRTTARIDESVSTWVASSYESVLGLEPDLIYHSDLIPNDPLFVDQYTHDNTGQPIPGLGNGTPDADMDTTDAWDTTIGSRDVIVAVIDTGVEITHPDLAANIWANPGEIPGNGLDDDNNGFTDDYNGWDFGDNDNNPDDDSLGFAHGTTVAGTLGAVGNNGIGVAGVAWNVSILPMKIATQEGDLTLGSIIGAHDYLTMMRDSGHNIVASNNSYGAFVPTFWEDVVEGFVAEKEAIRRFINSGGIFVASAGNSANNNDEIFTSFPASYDVPGIIAVAATDNRDQLAGFSSYGAETVDIAAPGVAVLTTARGEGYMFINGTSFSSPNVAGVVALLKTEKPSASGEEIRRVLIDSSDPTPSLQGKVRSGGRVNADRALQILNLTGPIIRSVDPGPVAGTPVNQITVHFNKELDGAFLSGSSVTLTASGSDGLFGDANDIDVAIDTVVLSSDSLSVTITPTTPLTTDLYRLTLDDAGFRDTDGNYLNGDASGGDDEVYDFDVVDVGGLLEPNDALAQATVISPFTGSGEATFAGMTLGDGAHSALDVDLYALNLPRGGLITAETIARNLPVPSTLDTMLRLFDANGNELFSNDQFNGSDSFLDYFVSTAGTYYVGVSGYPNDRYNPNVAGSGAEQSLGNYDLRIAVDLVENDRIVVEDSLEAPLLLPDQGTLTDTISITDVRQLIDVNVRVDIEHEFVSDLTLSLVSPTGVEILLTNRNGGAGNDFANTLFDDEATTTIANGTPPYIGSFRPQEALSRLDGADAVGLWTLRIIDNSALNNGQLMGWAMEITVDNDIFGPFELNDTTGTAKPLGINGSGSAARTAAVGDGGFGLLDVDLYSFSAVAGSTLATSVNSTGSLNSALRLFNADGVELTASNPTGTLDSTLRFVFPTGGDYFLGISDGDNAGYDPSAVATGTNSTTVGNYSLEVILTDGVSDGAILTEADLVGVGLGPDGVPGALDEFGTVNSLRYRGIEFLTNLSNSGSVPTAFFGAAADRFTFRNSGMGGTAELPFTVVDQSDVFNRRLISEGTFRGVDVRRTMSYGLGDSFIAIDVELTNASSVVIEGVSWMEGFNPVPGLNLDPITANTVNDVDNAAPRANASFFNNVFRDGLTISLAAPVADARASAAFLDSTGIPRDPTEILDFIDAGGGDPDSGIPLNQIMSLAFDIGDVSAGESASLRYFVLFGDSIADVDALYATINDGTGAGHLTADPGAPINDADGLALLPYTLYYPEGYANDRASTFIPIVNPHDQAARVVVIARYETGVRDAVLFDSDIAANTRGGLTLTTPALYAADSQLVRKDEPYAIEIRSELPVGATMSHFDFGVSTGESFTSQTSDTWTFARVSKNPDASDFIIFYNTSDTTAKVVTTLIPANGGTPIELVHTLEGRRRGGWSLANETAVPEGDYGVVITSLVDIVAAVSSYDASAGGGYGALATVGLGSLAGATPEGQFGLNAESEIITVLNASATTDADVTFTFLYESGSAHRTRLIVKAQTVGHIQTELLPGFLKGQAYSVTFESTSPVTVAMPTSAFGESEGSSLTAQAASLWAFGEGFRPGGAAGQVTEYLRVFNPQESVTLLEITLHFTDGINETFRQSVDARRVAEFDVHDFITGTRANADAFYGITVKGSDPIVAYLGRNDSFFNNGTFGTLGTPLGVIELL